MFGFLQLYKEKFEIKVKNLAQIHESSEEMNLYRLALKIQNEVYPPFNDDYPDLIAPCNSEAELQKNVVIKSPVQEEDVVE